VRLTARLDAWIFDEFRACALDLAIYRIVFAVYVLLWIVPIAPWIDQAPRAFFSPSLSAAVLLVDFPSPPVMFTLNLLLAAAASMLLIGWKTRAASLGTGLLIVSLKTFEYAIGKINHDIFIVAIPLIMAFSDWGNALSLDSRTSPSSAASRVVRGQWSLSYLAFIVAVAMFSAGWAKVASGWLDPAVQSTYGHFISNRLQVSREPWMAGWADLAGTTRLWEAADWSAALVELAFIVACFNSRWWRFVTAAAVVFHVGIWALFDIVFETNVIAYGAFLPYSRAITRWPAVDDPTMSDRRTLRTASLVFAIAFGAAMLAVLMKASVARIIHLPIVEIIVAAGFVIVCHWSLGLIRHSIPHRTRAVGRPSQPGSG
jgi:hypothetical protein